MPFLIPFIGPLLLKRGIKGALGAGLQIAFVAILALLIWFLVINPIRNHFKHIADLETKNELLKKDLVKVEGQRDTAIQLNRDNVKTLAVNKDIQHNREVIAGEERAAASARASTYREINNAIRNTPTAPAQPSQPRPPVAPVVTRTLDSLWSR